MLDLTIWHSTRGRKKNRDYFRRRQAKQVSVFLQPACIGDDESGWPCGWYVASAAMYLLHNIMYSVCSNGLHTDTYICTMALIRLTIYVDRFLIRVGPRVKRHYSRDMLYFRKPIKPATFWEIFFSTFCNNQPPSTKTRQWKLGNVDR